MGQVLFKGVEHYREFKKSFYIDKTNEIELEEGQLTRELYLTMFQLRRDEDIYNAKIGRKQKHSLPEIFQDLLAFYLKIGLSDDYEVIIEEKKGKIKPDIVIKYKGNYHYVIEVKTNIGWSRDSIKNGDFQKRINDIAQTFSIEDSKIIYIFDTIRNTKKELMDIYWDKASEKPIDRSQIIEEGDSVYKKVYPLFYNNCDDKKFQSLSDEEVKKKSDENKINSIENIIDKIKE